MAQRAPREGVDQAGVGPDRVDPHNSSLEQGGNYLPSLAADIRAAHDAVERNALAMAERAIDAGRLLLEAKKQVRHGGWLPWLQDNVGMSERTARRYMTLAKAGIKPAIVADMGIVGAVAWATSVEAVPLPEPGETIFGCDGNGRYLHIWNMEPYGQYLLYAYIDASDGPDAVKEVSGPHRGINRDYFHRALILQPDIAFDYAAATYERRAYEDDAEHLERLHRGFCEVEVASWPKRESAA